MDPRNRQMSTHQWNIFVYPTVGGIAMALVGRLLSSEFGVTVFATLGGAFAGASIALGVIRWDGLVFLISAGVGGVAGYAFGFTGKSALPGVALGAIFGAVALYLSKFTRR
jgi:hypothetical protein